MRFVSLIAALALTLSACTATPPSAPDLLEANTAQLQKQMTAGTLTAEQLVQYYLTRIQRLDDQGPQLNAVISVDPSALAQAKALDKERQAGKIRGPLHGIPVLLKDNIDSFGVANTGGSVLFQDNLPADDAFLVKKLREAGAIILGKANLSEWANFRSTRSSSGWSAMGGQTRNPYDPSVSTCGSSSGSGAAVAANLTALAVGTETDGSLVCPGAINGIVSIKPTLGLVSRDGIIPIAHSQDTAGPMTRTLSDAVLLLQVMAGEDTSDAASYTDSRDFTQHLIKDGLRGKRIGVVRSLMGYHPLLDSVFEQQLEVLRAQGATLVDTELDEQWGDDEFTILLHEFKADMAAYLATTKLPYRSLNDLLEANLQHQEQELAIFGQEIFAMAVARTDEQQAEYLEALARAKRLAGAEGIDALLAKDKLDLLIAPTVGPAWKTDHINGDHYLGAASSAAAVAGNPHITIPMGFVEVPGSPALPVGMSFFGAAKSEPVLIEAAFGYEQSSQKRRPPPLN
ncbi:amidase [Bowmanella yangjiangensis]|uniref:amidase n=1 Tax=Bowmanella yangjiangensis TaxID=2811230 RepID=UPI002FCDAC79